LFSSSGQHFSQGASSPVIGQVDDCSCDALEMLEEQQFPQEDCSPLINAWKNVTGQE
jgi:hypothetical protein